MFCNIISIIKYPNRKREHIFRDKLEIAYVKNDYLNMDK